MSKEKDDKYQCICGKTFSNINDAYAHIREEITKDGLMDEFQKYHRKRGK